VEEVTGGDSRWQVRLFKERQCLLGAAFVQLHASELGLTRSAAPQRGRALACRQKEGRLPARGLQHQIVLAAHAHSATYRDSSGGVKNAPRTFRRAGESRAAVTSAP